MYQQNRTATVGYAHSREEPDHRVHVGAGFAGWRAVCRCQVPAEGHSGTVAWRCGPKGELVLLSFVRACQNKGVSLFPQSYKTETTQTSQWSQQTTHSSMLRVSKLRELLSCGVCSPIFYTQ